MLSDSERERLRGALDEDGYAVLKERLPEDLRRGALKAILRLAKERLRDPTREALKLHNCVDLDPALRALMMYAPALQMAYDALGPVFHLCQSNLIHRPRSAEGEEEYDYVKASGWHADGPRPNLFPRVNGAMGLHYLKFGFFLTDLSQGQGGSLQVIRGSHRRLELDGKGPDFRVDDYAKDLVTLDCEAGTVVAFHQAQWHAAPPNRSGVIRENVYISYCPAWMKPLDRELPRAEDLKGLSPEETWLLGEPRPAMRWWLPSEEDLGRLARYARAGKRVLGSL